MIVQVITHLHHQIISKYWTIGCFLFAKQFLKDTQKISFSKSILHTHWHPHPLSHAHIHPRWLSHAYNTHVYTKKWTAWLNLMIWKRGFFFHVRAPGSSHNTRGRSWISKIAVLMHKYLYAQAHPAKQTHKTFATPHRHTATKSTLTRVNRLGGAWLFL